MEQQALVIFKNKVALFISAVYIDKIVFNKGNQFIVKQFSSQAVYTYLGHLIYRYTLYTLFYSTNGTFFIKYYLVFTNLFSYYIYYYQILLALISFHFLFYFLLNSTSFLLVFIFYFAFYWTLQVFLLHFLLDFSNPLSVLASYIIFCQILLVL